MLRARRPRALDVTKHQRHRPSWCEALLVLGGNRMALFREVLVPCNAAGRLLLHSMPGRRENLDDCWREIDSLQVHAIVCLASDEEIAQKSPSYLTAIASGAVPCQRWQLGVPDYGVPVD